MLTLRKIFSVVFSISSFSSVVAFDFFFSSLDGFGISLSVLWAILLFIYVYIFVKSFRKIKELNNKYGKNENIQ